MSNESNIWEKIANRISVLSDWMNLHTSQMQRDREPTKENIEHVHQYDERRTKIKGKEREREKNCNKTNNEPNRLNDTFIEFKLHMNKQ